MSFSLNGLASGLDTGTIISQLMQIERIPYQKLEQNKSNLNSEQSIFRSINTKLLTLRTAAEELSMSFGFDLRSAKNSDETVLRAVASETVPEGEYQIEVTQLATRHSVAVTVKDSEVLPLTISITKDDVTTPFTSDKETMDEALEDIKQQINNSELDVKAVVITTNESTGEKTLVITSNKSGEANDFSVTTSESDPDKVEVDIAAQAQDAIFKLNGVTITSSSNEIKDVVPGLNLTLLKAGETATVTVQRDIDKIIEKVDDFVKAYNDVISTIKSNTGKEKSLQGDSTLRSLESVLHRLVNSQVGEIQSDDNSINFLFQIGLEVDKGKVDAASMNGQLSFDKEKFKSAFTANPDEVIKLFTYSDEGDNSKDGIARQFKDILLEWTSSVTGILSLRIEGYTSEMKMLDQQMEAMQVRLDLKEAQMKKQFTAMETALIQLQNQQAWMASQIASMGIY